RICTRKSAAGSLDDHVDRHQILGGCQMSIVAIASSPSVVDDRPLPQRFYSLQVASIYTTFSEGHLRRLVAEHKLCAYRPEGVRRLIFDKSDLDKLITGKKTA